MQADELRAIQAPLKDRYRGDPDAAENARQASVTRRGWSRQPQLELPGLEPQQPRPERLEVLAKLRHVASSHLSKVTVPCLAPGFVSPPERSARVIGRRTGTAREPPAR